MLKNNQIKGLKYSRSLKKMATKHEKILRRGLENHDIWFKFQAFFFDRATLYIPDFRLATQRYKLIIEVDGKSHARQKDYDTTRTEWLNANRNCRVLRFTNEEIEKDIEGVMAKILKLHPLTNAKVLKDSLPSDTYKKLADFDMEFKNIVL